MSGNLTNESLYRKTAEWDFQLHSHIKIHLNMNKLFTSCIIRRSDGSAGQVTSFADAETRGRHKQSRKHAKIKPEREEFHSKN